jgi:hypothetical protein
MKRPVRSRLWGCRLRFCVGSWAQRIRRLHRWKTAPLSTGKERADDPAPAPTVLTRCDCSWRATPDGDPRRPLHRSRPSLRCPGSNGTSHSTPGPRCQRRQLRPHNQRHPDLTINRPHSCAPPPRAGTTAEQAKARGQRSGLCCAQVWSIGADLGTPDRLRRPFLPADHHQRSIRIQSHQSSATGSMARRRTSRL